MRRAAFVVAMMVATLMASASPGWSAPRPSRAQQTEQVGFNGDGFADLAVGAPGEAVGAEAGAGALNVLYGSADGLQPSADIFFQGSSGVPGTAEHDDAFGAAVAKGDFNGDMRFDVAVGVPDEAVGGVTLAGAVNVLYGSPGGLTGAGSQLFTQNNPEPVDFFGASLAAGDFDGDGFFDLAVGVPGEDVGGVDDAGAITVLFGSGGGITTAGSQTLFQGSGGIAGSAEVGDSFGHALASGLLANDDLADLVVGVPGENVGAISDAGAVNVLAGSSGGLVNGSLATQGNPEEGDAFGAAVATGDFDDTAGDDPAVGAPGETVGGRQAAGAVSVFNGPPSGLAAERLLSRGRPGSRAPRRPATPSGRRWRPPTPTASGSGTWPSASPARASGPTSRPAWSTCWPGRPPARAEARWCCRPTRRTSTSSVRPSPVGSSCTTSTTTASST